MVTRPSVVSLLGPLWVVSGSAAVGGVTDRAGPWLVSGLWDSGEAGRISRTSSLSLNTLKTNKQYTIAVYKTIWSCNETEQICLFVCVCACTSGLLECSWEHSRTWPSSVRSPFPSLLRLHDPWTTRRSPSPPPEFLYLRQFIRSINHTPQLDTSFYNAQQ